MLVLLYFGFGSLDLEQPGDHIVVKIVEVPDTGDESEDKEHETVEATDVRKQVEPREHISLITPKVQIPANCDADPCVVVFLVWHGHLWNQPEKAIEVETSELFCIEGVIVLQFQFGLLHLQRNYLPNLTANGNKIDSRSLSNCLFEINIGVESHVVVG